MIKLLVLLSAVSCYAQVPYDDVKSDLETLLSAYKMFVCGLTLLFSTFLDYIPAISPPNQRFWSGAVSQTNVVPRDPTSGPIVIKLGIDLDAVMDYEGVNGRIHLVGGLKIEWFDDIKTLTGITYKGICQTVYVTQNQIWTPDLLVRNSIDQFENIGDGSFIRYNLSSGLCQWNPKIVVNAACKPNLKYFPFDHQKCSLTVVPQVYRKHELVLEVFRKEWDTQYFEPSGLWNVDKTLSEAFVNKNTSQYNIIFSITIKRKPAFLALFIVLPALLISFLSCFVFLLPFEAGSRIAFGALCFLAFVSLHRMLVNLIPEASAPVPLLCHYITVMMTFVALISTANIFAAKIYLQIDLELPEFLTSFLKYFTCTSCKVFPKSICRCENKVDVDAASELCIDFNSRSDQFQRQDTVFNIRFSSMSRPVTSFDDLRKGSDCCSPCLSDSSLNEFKTFASLNEEVPETRSSRTDGEFNLRFSTNLKSLSQLSEVEESDLFDSPGKESAGSEQRRDSQELKRRSYFRSSSFTEERESFCEMFLARSNNDSDEELEHFCTDKPVASVSDESGESLNDQRKKRETDGPLCGGNNKMTRKEVATVLDRIFFVLFCIVQLVFSVALLVPTGA